MAGKMIRVRLYRMQDYDLYTLYYDPEFNLYDAFRKCVIAYAADRMPPSFNVSHVAKLPPGKPVRIDMAFWLGDEAAIRMLGYASQNGRNSNNIIKNLLRRSLVGIEGIYFDSENAGKYRDTVGWQYMPRQTFTNHENEGRDIVVKEESSLKEEKASGAARKKEKASNRKKQVETNSSYKKNAETDGSIPKLTPEPSEQKTEKTGFKQATAPPKATGETSIFGFIDGMVDDF